MEQIIEFLLKQINCKKDSLLVTVIKHEGSTPRGTGAQMLVGSDGRLCGSVGGGAIEGASIDYAKELLTTKRNEQKHFVLNVNKVGSIEMVCGGELTALFTFIAHDNLAWREVAMEIQNCFREDKHAFLVINMPHGNPILLSENYDKIAGCETKKTEKFDLSNIPYNGSCLEDYFVIPLPLPQRVIIFGGGHVAQALVPVLSNVGFSCVVFENRSNFATTVLFPSAKKVICGDYSKIEESLELKNDDFIIIMTNGHVNDLVIQERLLRQKFAYIGVMGSRKKIASCSKKLQEAGIAQEAIDSIHIPIGLSINAVTPAEIAISVAAECISERFKLRESIKPRGCPSQL